MDLSTRRDARSLPHVALEEMRRLAVRRVLAGEKQVLVGASIEIHPRTICKWVAAHRAKGEAALVSRKSSGRPPALDRREVEGLRGIIVGKNPLQLNFGTALWTLPILQQLIASKFGKALHATTIGRLLHRIGLTPQRPSRRAFQRNDLECQQWATEQFPAIVRRAKQLQASLLFVDEAGVHEASPVGTTWGERGRRPVVRVSGSRRKINVISAISPRGRFWFRCYKGMLNAPRFIEFLEAMLHDLRGRIVLVLDRHPAHTAAATRRFLLANSHRLEVHFLPAYAPDMNPDEHVWSHLKGLFRWNPLQQGEDLDASVAEAMTEIAGDRILLRSFFRHPEVAYVKAALKW